MKKQVGAPATGTKCPMHCGAESLTGKELHYLVAIRSLQGGWQYSTCLYANNPLHLGHNPGAGQPALARATQ